jgi:hypothetical protein
MGPLSGRRWDSALAPNAMGGQKYPHAIVRPVLVPPEDRDAGLDLYCGEIRGDGGGTGSACGCRPERCAGRLGTGSRSYGLHRRGSPTKATNGEGGGRIMGGKAFLEF